jgi:AcrR family transcriptional regulator
VITKLEKKFRTRAGAQKRARTRAALINAAARVLARLGPDAVSVDDIVTEAGVARGTFYNYFDKTEDIVAAVAAKLSDELLQEMNSIRSLSDPADRMACSVRSFILKASQDPPWGWVIVRIALLAAPLGVRMREFLTEDVEAGLASGRFHVASVQAGCDAALGLGLMGMRSVLRKEAGENHAANIAEMVLRALGVADAAHVCSLPLDSGSLAERARGSSETPLPVREKPRERNRR